MNADPFSTRYVTSPSAAAADRPPARGRRALVLGGGGSTGNAWLLGVVAGLVEAGTDVTGADLIIGTSAGSTAAAQITAAAVAELFAATLLAAPPRPTGPVPHEYGSAPTRPVADHLARMTAIIAAAEGPADVRRRLAAAALEDPRSDGSATERWRSVVAARLPHPQWPDRPVLITAVDADTGEPVVFDRASGVDLVDAVAASCAGTLAYAIGGHRYIDGGYRRSSENADLAAGCERVLVLSPLGGRSLMPPEWGVHLAAQVEELRAAGSAVQTIVPDAGDEHLFGAHAMDGSLRPAAARAGHDQGRALAGQLADYWSDDLRR